MEPQRLARTPRRAPQRPAGIVSGLADAIRVVVRSISFRPEVVTLQVVKFPPRLQSGQGEEILDGSWLHLLQGSMQSEHRLLQHVIRFDPPPQGRELVLYRSPM